MLVRELLKRSLVVSFIAACAPEVSDISTEQPEGKAESPERIDSVNDPNRFNLTMNRRLADLPASGDSLRRPFPSNWWPMRTAGIAQRWNAGQPSPAEKYDLLATPEMIRDVELTLAQRDHDGMPANMGATPERFHIGPAAEWEHRNHGRYGATDPDSWWGHCNGWSSYVLNEDEPVRPVSVRMDRTITPARVVECASASEAGCVRFELGDINALGAELYWNDAARLLGRRCEQASSEFNFDTSGRINSVECRDGNAGSFHIITTNMIGLMRRPYIVDLNADQQVWNYPVYSYRVTSSRDIAVADALREIGAPAGTTTWTYNTDAVRLVRVTMQASLVEDAVPPSTQPQGGNLARYTTVETYDYVLELDAAGTIIGGEWVGRSKTDHPDFMWYSYGNTSYAASSDDLLDADNTALRYSVFKQILTAAQSPLPPAGAGVLRVSSRPALALAIPDNDANGVVSALEVGESFVASAVRVNVNISHTYRGDLVVALERGSQSYVLSNLAGGGDDDLIADFDVPAASGSDVRGTWTLRVSDRAGTDVGTLNAWTLDLTRSSTPPVPPVPSSEPLRVTASPNLAIPDNNTGGIRSSVEVTESFVSSSVRVIVDIAHTYRGDLRVILTRGAQSFTLHDRTGGSADNLMATFTVDGISAAEVRGTWTLQVIDTARTDTGTLRSWTLELARPGSVTPPPVVAPVSRTFASVGAAVSIPDASTAGVRSTISVGENIRIDTLQVELNITHPYIGDLRVTLSNGTATQVLHANEGGSTDNIRRTIDTAAFRNISSSGTWTLEVVDNAAQDVGSLDSWRMVVGGVLQ